MAVPAAGGALAQVDPAQERLRGFDPPDAVLRIVVAGREAVLQPWDIAAVEVSESGGITDIFVRLAPAASETLTVMTAAGAGAPMTVCLCGRALWQIEAQEATTTDALYLPGTTAARGEVLRALWQGRARCDTVDPEVFADGH